MLKYQCQHGARCRRTLHFQLEQNPAASGAERRHASQVIHRFSAQGYSLGTATTLVFCHRVHPFTPQTGLFSAIRQRVRINNYLTIVALYWMTTYRWQQLEVLWALIRWHCAKYGIIVILASEGLSLNS